MITCVYGPLLLEQAYRASTQAPLIATCRSMQQLCWLKAMDYHLADPQSGYNAGVLICMPVCFASPCCLCGLPGQLCPHCAEAYCSGCGHFCDVPPREYEDSQWGSDAEPSPRLGETGGSGEDARKAANYAGLASAYENPSAWTQLEDGLFLRCQTLAELNTCYIHDGDAEEPRRFGSMRDWRRVGDFMAWHHPTIVLVNAVVKKTFVFEVSRPPAVRDMKLALRELRSNPSWLGFVCHGDETEPCFLHIEVWWSPEEHKAFARRCIVRDKLLRAVLKMNKSVSFWRP